MARKRLPSAAYLRAVFRYDRRSGRLFWRRRADVGPEWNARFAGRPAGGTTTGCILVQLKGFKLVRAHRIIWKMFFGDEPDEIDHRDGNPFNNRLGNLRRATRSQNICNRRVRPGASGFRGVTRDRKRWAARITVNYRVIWLGTFDDPAAAHRAYLAAARIHHGEFMRRE